MAIVAVNSSGSTGIQFTWIVPTGISTPEIAATWGLFQMMADGQIVTSVRDPAGNHRPFIHTSAYPLAEWLTFHWWQLTRGVRHSTVSRTEWRWSNVTTHSWLRDHNFRAVSNGMAWPDLTLMPEGDAFNLVWNKGPGLHGQPIFFESSGNVYVSREDLILTLSEFVEDVDARLNSLGITGTPMQDEWRAIKDSPTEDRVFSEAAARLDLDPYDLEESDEIAIEVALADHDQDLVLEACDIVRPTQLLDALQWVSQAKQATHHRADLPSRSKLRVVHQGTDANTLRPWAVGYELARAARLRSEIAPDTKFPVEELVHVIAIPGEFTGLDGFAHVSAEQDAVDVVLAKELLRPATTRFHAARGLGLAHLSGRRDFLLTESPTFLTQASRAFAAELLAPAAGIRALSTRDELVLDETIEEIADHYGVSPLVVSRQIQNHSRLDLPIGA